MPSLCATSAYRYLNGSKNVILEKAEERQSWYGTDAFRYKATEGLSLHKGEVLYFELVGWAAEATPIMPPHDVTKTGLKELRAQYGDTIHYTYGCPQGTCRLYVYKIAMVNPDGVAVELSWPEMVRRCRELGLAHVPLLEGPILASNPDVCLLLDLRNVVDKHTTGPSTLSPIQIREGVVVRVESTQGITHIKHKSFEFGVLEGYLSESEEFVDPEEVS